MGPCGALPTRSRCGHDHRRAPRQRSARGGCARRDRGVAPVRGRRRGQLDPRPASRLTDESAMTTVQYVVAVGFALVIFVMLANLVVDLYARGVVRAAVDEGARAGARLDAGRSECERRASAVLDDLLGAETRAGVAVRCTTDAGLGSRPGPGLVVQHRATRDKGASPVTRRVRGDEGFVAVELSLGVAMLLLPVTLVVLTLPTWSERQAAARAIAREVARAAAIAGACDEQQAQDVADEMAA